MQDIFRINYRQLTTEQHELIRDIKNQAYELMDLLSIVNKKFDIRSGNIAKTKLEECVMWATKSVSWNPESEK